MVAVYSLIQTKVQELIDSNDTTFSVNFQACLTLRRMLLDARCSLQDVAQFVITDPIVSASILRTANSARYGSRNIHSVYVAVNMLGGRTLNYVAFAVMQRQLLNIMPDSFRLLTEKLWGYSLEVAGTSYAIGSLRANAVVSDEVTLLSMLLHLDTMFVLYALSKTDAQLVKDEVFPALVKRLLMVNRKKLLQTYSVPIDMVDTLSMAYRSYEDVTYSDPLTALEVLTLALNTVAVPTELANIVPVQLVGRTLEEEYKNLKESLIESLQPI